MLRSRLMNSVCFAPEGSESGGTTTTAAAVVEPATFSVDYVRELRAENKGYRLRASELEKTATEAKASAAKFEADLKAAAEHTEKAIAAKVGEVSAAAAARLVRAEIKAGAVAAGIAHLDFVKLLDTSAVKVGEDGEVSIPDDFWTAAKTRFAHLFTATGADKGTTTTTAAKPAPAATGTKKASEMTDEEWKAALARVAKGQDA